MAQPHEAVTDRVAEEIGAHRVEEPEATALLALARRVAQASDDRRKRPGEGGIERVSLYPRRASVATRPMRWT